MNIPTMLTVGRVAVVPVIAALMWMPPSMMSAETAQVLAALLFALAAVTDWLDGYLARRLNQTSAFGAFLDPVADKLLVCTSLVILVEVSRLPSAIAIIIICREIAVSALREWMAQIGHSKVVAVAMAGKVKTAMQLVGIPLMMASIQVGGLRSVTIGAVLLWGAATLAVWSMWLYARAAMQRLRSASLGGGGGLGTRWSGAE